MNIRLAALLIIHLLLGILPISMRLIPPAVSYSPLYWALGSLIIAQVMLLAFWAGLGNGSWQWRLFTTIAGCGYLFTWMSFYNRDLTAFIALSILLALLSGVFLLMRRWFVLQLIAHDKQAVAHDRWQFSIWQLLVVTSVAAVILGLARGARLANIQNSSGATVLLYALFFTTFALNAICAAWAALSVSSYRTKVAWSFVVAVLVGIAGAFATIPLTGAPGLPWWFWLNVPFEAVWLTFMIVATLLVVRSCGYRLLPRT